MPFRYLFLDGNTKLKGCIPVSGFSTVQYADTDITGLCFGDPGSAQWAQVAALNTTFRQMLRFGQINERYDAMIDNLITQIAPLASGSVVAVGQNSASFFAGVFVEDFDTQGSTIRLDVETINGVEHITSIKAVECGLNLTYLPQLAAALPNLKRFYWRDSRGVNDRYPYKAADLWLPPSLPLVASVLEELTLSNSTILGTLPVEYGNWPSLKSLNLQDNNLTGAFALHATVATRWSS